MNQMVWLTNVDKVVGVLIAGLGAYATSPEGAKHLREWVSGWFVRTSRRALRPLSRVLPFGRRRHTILPKRVAGSSTVSATLTMTASGWAWRPSAPVDVRIEALRAHLVEVEGRLNETVRKAAEEKAAYEIAVQELLAKFEAEIERLDKLLEVRDREAARIDGRGLPLIFLGILLTAVPEYPTLFLPVGWAVPIGAISIAIALGMHLLRA
jgi:hypothetical protein